MNPGRHISIAPLGVVDDEVVDTVALALWATYGLPVERWGPLPDPAAAFDPRRNQFSAPLVLKGLQKELDPRAVRLLGITSRDLFIPMLSFVYGQAQVGGAMALLSVARLQQEFYGLPPNRELTLSRAVKEAVHEVGHTFGLIHCSDIFCPMSLSNTIVQVDRKRDSLCDSCAASVHETIRGVTA